MDSTPQGSNFPACRYRRLHLRLFTFGLFEAKPSGAVPGCARVQYFAAAPLLFTKPRALVISCAFPNMKPASLPSAMN